MKPNVMRELMLPQFGLELLPLESTFTPLDDDYLLRTADGDQTYREIARHSRKDAEAYKRFGPLMGQIGMAVRPILETIAPNALRPSISDVLATKKLLNHFKTLSKEQFEYLTKLMTMSSADFLDEWFEFEPLKSTMSVKRLQEFSQTTPTSTTLETIVERKVYGTVRSEPVPGQCLERSTALRSPHAAGISRSRLRFTSCTNRIHRLVASGSTDCSFISTKRYYHTLQTCPRIKNRYKPTTQTALANLGRSVFLVLRLRCTTLRSSRSSPFLDLFTGPRSKWNTIKTR